MKLGYAHPDYLLDDLSNTQLMEWRAFDAMEPIGEYRNDYMMGQLTALVYNLAQSIHGKKNSVNEPLRTEDFIPWLKTSKEITEEQPRGLSTPEDIKALFMALKKQQG